MVKNKGKIIEPAACTNIREHERQTARAFAMTGLTVEFIPESKTDLTKSPDLLVNGVRYEMKSPQSGKMTQIEKNLKNASKQSPNIILDSQRVKFLPDKKIEAFLVDRFRRQKSIKRLLFVNRKREIVDIAKKI